MTYANLEEAEKARREMLLFGSSYIDHNGYVMDRRSVHLIGEPLEIGLVREDGAVVVRSKPPE